MISSIRTGYENQICYGISFIALGELAVTVAVPKAQTRSDASRISCQLLQHTSHWKVSGWVPGLYNDLNPVPSSYGKSSDFLDGSTDFTFDSLVSLVKIVPIPFHYNFDFLNDFVQIVHQHIRNIRDYG